VPVVNGGNGSVEHPTPASLDLSTIREEKGTINKLHITFVGDLKYGRTVHSLLQLLRHYEVSIQLVSPPGLELPTDLRAELVCQCKLVSETQTLSDDVVRVTCCTALACRRSGLPMRMNTREPRTVVVNNKSLARAKPHMIVLHPLPRNRELDEEGLIRKRRISGR
jgi:carbamoyl-phosphate synthase / aspartate carbamoyltransferase